MSGTGDEIRVLHVDDDEAFTEVAAMHLERAHEAITVVSETGTEAGLERLAAEPVDCVVSDHDMPGRNGLAFLRAVRDRYGDLPFILFTGKGDEEIASDAISAGVTEYLQKDLGTDQYTLLANRIERAVSEHRARAALEKSERRQSTLIANLPGMVYRARNEPDWPMLYVSEGAERLTGYSADALERGEVDWASLIHDHHEERLWESVQTSLAAGDPFEVTYPIDTREGETRWMWERGRAVDTEDGVEILEGFITDITVRKERERELERERAFTEELLDAIPDAFYLVSPDGDLRRWNDALAERSGYSDAEIESMDMFDFFPPDCHEALSEAVERALETGSAAVELPIVTADGERVPHEFRGSTVHRDGELVGIAGIAREVTDRRQRERELERYETVVEAVGDPVYTLDAEGVFTFVNPALAELTGYEPDDLVGRHIGTVMTDGDLETGRELIRDLLSDSELDTGTFEMALVTSDGGKVPCENHMALLPADGERFAGTAGVIRDISDRKAREERLDEFTTVVSHDLRGPLNVIQGRAELVQETGDRDHVEDIVVAADRMEDLIGDLLTLARQGESVGETEVVSLSAAAERAWSTLETGTATLEVAGETTVEADPRRFGQLLANLFRNSVEHGGTDRGGASGDPLTVTVGPLADGFYVADDGPGVPPDEREQVFERGYTTAREGTGFGLAIVADVAEAHGWTVDLAESVDGGARFDVTTSPPDR